MDCSYLRRLLGLYAPALNPDDGVSLFLLWFILASCLWKAEL
jgi:hypothetical protein